MFWMNKQEIVKALTEELGPNYNKEDAETFLNAYLKVQHDCFMRGEKFKIVGHGTFFVKTRKEKRGVNPKSPEQKINIPAKKTVVFIPGTNMKADLNGKNKPE